MSIQTIATCLTVSVTRTKGWQQSATDKSARDTVVSTTGASTGRVTVKTTLLDLPVCNNIGLLYTSISDKLKTFGTSLGTGRYLIPASFVAEAKLYLDACQAQLDSLKATLASEYATFLATQEQSDLGTLFDRKNYADVRTVLAGTTIQVSFDTLSDNSAFAKLFTDDQLIAELSAANDAQQAKIADDAAKELFATLVEQVETSIRIVENYHNGGKRIASESACERLKTTCINLDLLNNALFRLPCTKLGGALASVLAAVPVDHLTLKDAFVGSTFVNSLRVAVGAAVAPTPTVTAQVAEVDDVFDIDADTNDDNAEPVAVGLDSVFDIDDF